MMNEDIENIVVFPSPKRDTPPQSVDEMLSRIEGIRSEYVKQFMETHILELTSKLKTMGFDVDQNERMYEEFLYAMECLNSVLCRSVNIEHAWHAEFDENHMMKEEIQGDDSG